MMKIKAIMHQALLKYEWSVPKHYKMDYQDIPIGKPGKGFSIQLKG